jgi:Uma2 family endonuclease
LTESNTKSEMTKKLGEYFEAGVRVVWLVGIRKRTVRAHTAIDQSVHIKQGQTLDGGGVLPGFVLRLEELFTHDEP